MDRNTDLKIIDLVSKFPVGDTSKNRVELLSKASVVAFLAQFQEQFSGYDDIYAVVKDFLKDKLGLLDNEEIPDVNKASDNLKLSNGFNSISFSNNISISFDLSSKCLSLNFQFEHKKVLYISSNEYGYNSESW